MREMRADDLYRICVYEFYGMRCGRPALEGELRCSKHIDSKCISCGEPATHGCPYEGQFVCGYPLCDDCEGWNDHSKPSGNWGFVNHSHRRKPTLPPLAKMIAGDIGQ